MSHSRSVWVERLSVTNFRNYDSARLDLTDKPVVLLGENGSGKTNLLEAVSLLAPDRGLRRAPYAELSKAGGAPGWTISAVAHTTFGDVRIGTGVTAEAIAAGKTSRTVRINGEPAKSSGALADYMNMVWLVPAMDGLFTGPAGDRRRFLDRLIATFDPGYRTHLTQYERAMRQRNKLLENDASSPAEFMSLETQMAERGIAIAAARNDVIDQLSAAIMSKRDAAPDDPFPWAHLEIEGTLEDDLRTGPALAAEERYLSTLRSMRNRDRGARRTLIGPHRSDLLVKHGPKGLPARVCSTGEQKALLVGLVLAHAQLLANLQSLPTPILLLDEIAAHLDQIRRESLYQALLEMGAQAWITGTDKAPFEALGKDAQFFSVAHGSVSPNP